MNITVHVNLPPIDYAERIRVRNRSTRWAFSAARDGRLHARLERIRARSIQADDLARTLRQEGKPEVAGFWTALRDCYYKAHERALQAPRRI